MKRKAKPLVTESAQTFTFTRRALFLGAAEAGVAALLGGRMAWLAIAENEHYKLLSESNRVQLVLVPPRRGWIVDRKGVPIAVNRSDYRVDLIPDQIEDKDRIVAELAKLLELPQDEVDRIHDGLAKAAGYQPVPVAENMSFDHYAAVTLRLPELPGVAPMRGFSRFYPEGAAVGHLIGYVGAASKEEYEKEKNPLLITPGFKVGKEGLEKVEEMKLRGRPGAKRLEVTARGKLIRELSTVPDGSGNTLQLPIDAGLQAYAARRMGNESGSVVVMDCHTGDLLCMASMPAYDPNSFSDGIGRMEWKMLSDDERRPLNNKTLNALYPPGSTLKPMAAMALLGAGVDPEDIINCGGGYQLGNRFFRCLGRHGPMNLHRAIAKSCNAYFYGMAHRVGYDTIAKMARTLGLGVKYDLPVVSQSYGTIPDSAWKMKRYKQAWTHSDSLNAVIGQGYVIVNPLQLGVMAARIASGRDVSPRLIGLGKPAPILGLPQEHLEAVRSGMWEVVNGNGTAGRSRLEVPGVEMCGKTGTAQVRRIAGGQRGQSGDWKYRDHGLFVFFAPFDKPRFAGSVVIDHGMGGARAAAPIAKDVLTYLFDKPKALASLAALEEGWGGDIKTRMARKSEEWMAANGTPRPAV